MSTKTRIAILGAGGRGTTFGELARAHAHEAEVVAVAEIDPARRAAFATAHQLPAERCFASWTDFVAAGKLADAVIIATLDREHKGPAIACLEMGCDLLLEKPMATTLADCQAIEAAQRRSGRIVAVCHSLRYQKGFRKVKELLSAGAVGRIMSMDLIEQVAWWHQAHSFVRGNWGNSGRSTFMLLAKSCHDIDYLAYLADRPCQRVSSFGHLSYFTRANAPAGSTERCADPCPLEPTCPYSAIRNYVNTNREQWPATMCSLTDHSAEAHLAAIRTGPYGRCVWKCDNDVVDHQVVNLEFADQITATFTMTAFTQKGGRILRVFGTEADLYFDEGSITLRTFADNNTQRIDIGHETGGHGGGDSRVFRDWLIALRTRDPGRIVTSTQESLRTHAIVFAAETSRMERRMMEVG